MQRISILLSSFALLLPALCHGFGVETAYSRHYAADEIRTVGNHLGKPLANQGFRTVLASQPQKPGGHYFILRLDDAASAAPALARITLYTSDAKESTVHSWDLSKADLKAWLYLGLTGSDWPGEAVQPLAWRVEFLDGAGNPIAEWKSFLWELP